MYRLSCDCHSGPGILFAGVEFRFACVSAAEQLPGVARVSCRAYACAGLACACVSLACLVHSICIG
jgi:hypothetical protein